MDLHIVLQATERGTQEVLPVKLTFSLSHEVATKYRPPYFPAADIKDQMDGPVRSTDPHRPHSLLADWLCLTAWKVLIEHGPIRKGSRRFFS